MPKATQSLRKGGPRTPEAPQEATQVAPKTAQGAPKVAQVAPKVAKFATKGYPSRPQGRPDVPKAAQGVPKAAKESRNAPTHTPNKAHKMSKDASPMIFAFSLSDVFPMPFLH